MVAATSSLCSAAPDMVPRSTVNFSRSASLIARGLFFFCFFRNFIAADVSLQHSGAQRRSVYTFFLCCKGWKREPEGAPRIASTGSLLHVQT